MQIREGKQDEESESESSGSFYVRPKYGVKDEESEQSEGQSTPQEKKRSNYEQIQCYIIKSMFLISIWLFFISAIKLFQKLKWLGYGRTMGCACVSCFLGGYGSSIFSQISIDLVNISRSRKDKFKNLAMATSMGHILGPLILAYLVIYQSLFITAEPEIKFMATFSLQFFILMACFYRILRIISQYHDRTLNLISGPYIDQINENASQRKDSFVRQEEIQNSPEYRAANRNSTFQGFLEKSTLFISYVAFSVNTCFLSLNLICQNFQNTSELGLETFSEYEYVKIFGLFDLVILSAVPYLFCLFTSTCITPCLKKFEYQSRTNHILVLIGLLNLGIGVLLQTMHTEFKKQNMSIQNQYVSMLLSQILIGTSSALITQSCHACLLWTSKSPYSK